MYNFHDHHRNILVDLNITKPDKSWNNCCNVFGLSKSTENHLFILLKYLEEIYKKLNVV
jgi:hypothetical protein